MLLNDDALGTRGSVQAGPHRSGHGCEAVDMGDGPAGEGARGHPPSSRGHVHVPPGRRACARRGAAPGPRALRSCSEPGLGRVAGPSVCRARGLQTPGAPLPRRPAVLAQPVEAAPSAPLHHLGSFQKTRSSWLQMCGNQPTRRLRHGARPPRLRTSSRWAGSASLGPGARAARAACPHEPLWNPAQPSGRLSLGFPPLGLRVSHFRIAHGPPRTAPAHEAALTGGPDRRRGPAPWPLRPAPAWLCPRRFSGCVLLLQTPPAGGRGTGSGRDALGTEPHRLVSPAASCCPGLRCD